MYISLPKFKYLQSRYSFLRLWHQWVSTPSRGVPKTLVASGVSQMSRIRKRKADSNFLTQLHHTESSQTYFNQTQQYPTYVWILTERNVSSGPTQHLLGWSVPNHSKCAKVSWGRRNQSIPPFKSSPWTDKTWNHSSPAISHKVTLHSQFRKNWCKQIIKLLIARVRTKMVTMKDYPLYRIRMASHYDWLEVLPTQCL